MSTKKIHEALDWMRQQSIGNSSVRPMVEAALAEVEAIEKAARWWVDDRTTSDQWEFVEASLESIAKESGK